MLKWNSYSDLSIFKKEVIPYLEKSEAKNNLSMGLINNMKDQEPALMATMSKDTDVLLIAFQTTPQHNIILSSVRDLSSDEVEEISQMIAEKIEGVSGIIGDRNLVLEIADKLLGLYGIRYKVQMNQKIYELQKVKKPPQGKGSLRKAELTDLPLISNWVYQFCEDINEQISVETARKKAEEIITNQSLYVWEINELVVSMANTTRPTQNNITINLVYTPKNERKKGYASNCVAALSQQLLNDGYKTTSLYTDADNPTSNKIYMEIGYEEIAESIVVRKENLESEKL